MVINARRALRFITNTENPHLEIEIWTPTPKDKVPEGTMAGAKSRCPVCGVNLTPDYIKECGATGKLSARVTAVVVNTNYGKEYRLPICDEETAVSRTVEAFPQAATKIPFGFPDELQQRNPRTLIVQLYNLTTWGSIFTSRQMLSAMTFVKYTREARSQMDALGYPIDWVEALESYLV